VGLIIAVVFLCCSSSGSSSSSGKESNTRALLSDDVLQTSSANLYSSQGPGDITSSNDVLVMDVNERKGTTSTFGRGNNYTGLPENFTLQPVAAVEVMVDEDAVSKASTAVTASAPSPEEVNVDTAAETRGQDRQADYDKASRDDVMAPLPLQERLRPPPRRMRSRPLCNDKSMTQCLSRITIQRVDSIMGMMTLMLLRQGLIQLIHIKIMRFGVRL